MEYKESQYNVYGKINTDNILTNTYSGAIMTFDTEDYNAVKEVLKDKTSINKYKDTDIGKKLIDNGYIIEKEKNEIENLANRHTASKGGKDALGIAIGVTQSCNFRCVYCFEYHDDKNFTSELEERVIKYLENNLNNKKTLRIIWWGGEPLLRLNFISRFSTILKSICKEKGVKYESSIVTNGYLLSKKSAKVLANCNINHIQITLDGAQNEHDKRRFLKNSNGTFKTIINNLYDVANLFKHIIIRVNVDKRNAYNVHEIFNHLSPIKNKVFIALRPANDLLASEQPDWMIDFKDFNRLEYEFMKTACDNDFNVIFGYQMPGTSYCNGYQSDNSFLFDSYGNVQVCPIYTGNEAEKFGSLNKDGNIDINQGSNQYKWRSKGWPFTDEDCIKCKALPICMGGCLMLDKDSALREFRCSAKYNIAEKMFLNSLWVNNFDVY